MFLKSVFNLRFQAIVIFVIYVKEEFMKLVHSAHNRQTLVVQCGNVHLRFYAFKDLLHRVINLLLVIIRTVLTKGLSHFLRLSIPVLGAWTRWFLFNFKNTPLRSAPFTPVRFLSFLHAIEFHFNRIVMVR